MYRLALNLGSTALGFAIVPLDQDGHACSVSRLGARCYDDGRVPKTRDSLGAVRRHARIARRTRDRKTRRKHSLRHQLTKFGLLPNDIKIQQQIKSLDPLQLRVKALYEPCTKLELSRIFFSINLRRGFQFTRSSNIKERGCILNIQKNMASDMEINGLKTVAEYLLYRKRHGMTTTIHVDNELVPSRQMLKSEFDLIQSIQSKHHQDIPLEAWRAIEKTIFYQRPLKEVELGQCVIFPDQKRTYKALPSYKIYRILDILSGLRIKKKDGYVDLSIEEKLKIFDVLNTRGSMSRSKFHSFLGLTKNERSNLKNTKEMIGNKTAALLSQDKYFGPLWFSFSLGKQDAITLELIKLDSNEIYHLAKAQWGVSEEQANNLSQIPLTASEAGRKSIGLELETQSFSLKALRFLSHEMKKRFVSTSVARKLIGYPEPEYTGQYDKMLYYGEVMPQVISNFYKTDKPFELRSEEQKFGKINNPTCHIVLNQTRKLVNRIIAIYGKPDQIVVELSKELKHSYELEDERKKLKDKNLKKREEVIKILKSRFGIETPTKNQITQYKLWEELNEKNEQLRFCPYSGFQITAENLFTHFVIDHIIPFFKSYDNTFGNKTLCAITILPKKKDKCPYEAFGTSEDPKIYKRVLERISELPADKQELFAANAVNKIKERMKHLYSDRAFIANTFKMYLQTICKDTWVVNKKLNYLLRRSWDLGAIISSCGHSYKEDYRRYALNAVTIGMADSELSILSQRAVIKKDESGEFVDVKKPWEGFYDDVDQKFSQIVVSSKQEHAVTGRLLKEQVYGKVKNPEKYNGCNLVVRKSIVDVNPDTILDSDIKEKILALPVHEKAIDNREERLNFIKQTGIKRVRTLVKMSNPIEVRHTDRAGVVHVKHMLSAENHHVSVWSLPLGVSLRNEDQMHVYNLRGFKCRYIVCGHNLYDMATQADKKPHPAAKLLMRLHKGDMVICETKTGRTYARVLKLDPLQGRIFVQPHFSEYDEVCVGFPAMLKMGIQKIHVDELGYVRSGENLILKGKK